VSEPMWKGLIWLKVEFLQHGVKEGEMG